MRILFFIYFLVLPTILFSQIKSREEAPKNALPPKTAAQAFAPATAESLEAKFIPGEEDEDDDLPF